MELMGDDDGVKSLVEVLEKERDLAGPTRPGGVLHTQHVAW